MGVHNLWRLLDTFGEVTQPEQWRGKRVAIDASIWMAQFRAKSAAGDNLDQVILEGFFLRILKLLFYGIEPVFVFDGVATSSKRAEHRRRAERRDALNHAAICRRARQIVSAQVAAGVLNVHTLQPRNPERSAKPVRHETQRVDPPAAPSSRGSGVKGKALIPSSRALQRLKRKRRRALVAPEAVSMAATHAFLSEAKGFIEERKRGERCLEANVLLQSSTSLFLGPRHVLDGAAVCRSASSSSSSSVPSVVCTATKHHGRVVNVDDCDRSSSSVVVESNGSVDVQSSNSVEVVDYLEDTFVGRLRAFEETDRGWDSSTISKEDTNDYDSDEDEGDEGEKGETLGECKESDEIVVMDDESMEDSDNDQDKDGDASEESADTTSGSRESALLWNPGTQLTRQLNAMQEGSKFLEPNMKNEETSITTPPANIHTAHLAASGRPTVTISPFEKQPTRQVIPFELLDIVELLDCCGVSYVLSPSEADAQCAFLNKEGLVDAVFTEDSDVIVHGAPVVLRGFFSKGRSVVAYRQRDLKTCGIDKEVLVTMALLLGCDYAEGVGGIRLLDALHVVAAVWHLEDENGVRRVLQMLRRWRSLLAMGDSDSGCLYGIGNVCLDQWKEDGTTLAQFILSQTCREKWADLRIPEDFPQSHVAEAFFETQIDRNTSPFLAAVPDWTRLRTFAAVHGLLGTSLCRQRLDLAQREYAARAAEKVSTEDPLQRRLTDFGVKSKTGERYVYKKQPPKLVAILSLLRSVKQLE